MTEHFTRTLLGFSPAAVAAALAQVEQAAAAESARWVDDTAAAQRGTAVVRRELKHLQARLNQTVDQAQTDLLATLSVQGQDRQHLQAAALDLDAQRGLLLDQILGGETIATRMSELQMRFTEEMRELVARYREALDVDPKESVPAVQEPANR